MKTFDRIAAQGDLMIVKIDRLPVGLTKIQAEKGSFVVAHSETGHNHIVKERPNVTYYAANDPMVSYLEVVEATDETEVFL